MNVIELPIDRVVPYERNPRKNDKAVEAVANSIKEFGFKVPIIIDTNNVVVAGHTIKAQIGGLRKTLRNTDTNIQQPEFLTSRMGFKEVIA